jgi:hypothetical protein
MKLLQAARLLAALLFSAGVHAQSCYPTHQACQEALRCNANKAAQMCAELCPGDASTYPALCAKRFGARVRTPGDCPAGHRYEQVRYPAGGPKEAFQCKPEGNAVAPADFKCPQGMEQRTRGSTLICDSLERL